MNSKCETSNQRLESLAVLLFFFRPDTSRILYEYHKRWSDPLTPPSPSPYEASQYFERTDD